MDKLKSHPLEIEADRIVTDLDGDLERMKQVMDTGISYNFLYASENEIRVYLCLVTYVPTRSDNLFRLEFTVGEANAEDVGRILFAITLDMDLQRYNTLRVIPRTKNHRTYEIILQSVCNVDMVSEGFLSSTTIAGLELATCYRYEFLK